MDEQIKQIARRLAGLRDSLDLSIAEMAQSIAISQTEYAQYESGNFDIPMSVLCKIAQNFGVETSTLVSGTEPHAQAYFLTRKGKGASIERTKAYKYQDLASGFKNAKSTPFEVTVEPNDNPMHLNQHEGQEFNYVLEGKLMLHIADSELILSEGDSIYFDAQKPHGMKALDNKEVRFLAIII
ncbi:MAG: XRE family transcriptional regulator [Sphingobacteriia bacterium]|jgi:transcriptional regulator with XRE-family HTH domain|nr:cupin domain-containing protein [Paludibacteraceae bacterium]NCA79141.1 XRE family transcriptional regulator [Sphingobacteriia bacterium]